MKTKQATLRGIESLAKNGDVLTALEGTLTFLDGSFAGKVNLHLDIPEILKLTKEVEQEN
jgi:hypothetical protein